MKSKEPKIVLIGGGTGSFTLLQELKKLTPNISAVVNMSDDGGSTGVLRDELGVLPPGDVRQCLVALSDLPEIRELFSYRFAEGRFEGQSLGNIILSGLELQYGSFQKAIKVVSGILHITGQVVPVTLDKHTLVLQDGNKSVRGEYKIGHIPIENRDATLTLSPKASINPEAKQVIQEADLIVIAPGNLFGSLLPIFVVDGVADALKNSRAKVVSVANLVTKPGQTDGWHVADYVKQFERYIGEGRIDAALYNTALPSRELLKNYAAEGEYPVDVSADRFSEVSARPVGAKLVAGAVAKQNPSDKAIKRTLIRHDAGEVAKQLQKLI